MIRRAVTLLLLLQLAACDRPSPAGGPTLDLDQSPGSQAVVEARGLDVDTAKALKALAPEAWPAVFSVGVGPGLPPVSGRYELDGRTARFVPELSLQPGRTYQARFDPPGPAPAVTAQLTPAAPQPGAATRVAAVYPSGGVWPQNLLRLYIRFSGPMAPASTGGLGLIDQDGRPVDQPFLPLGYEFWSLDRTRLTVLLDPGRVKRGVLGEPVLTEGRRYTLVVGRDWRDAAGRPLAASYSLGVRIGPPERRAIDPASWRVTAPRAGSREPLRLAFDRALDRGLLMSALGVAAEDGRLLHGRVMVEPGETVWSFLPDKAWERGAYAVAVGRRLEDPAGNRPGRAFEAAAGAPGARSDPAAAVRLPFAVR